MITKYALPLVLLGLASANASAEWNPQPNWKDSYSVDGRCYCDSSNFDHNLDSKSAETPNGRLNVVQICADIEAKLGTGSSSGRIPYNDIQCGHGPANDAADEKGCPGRVDIGAAGCNVKGPKWDLEAVYGNGDSAAAPARPATTGEVPGPVSTAASNSPGATRFAVDDNIATRWSTGEFQRPGQVFQLDLGQVQIIGKVILDTRNSPGDDPAGYSLSTSIDGNDYSVAATGSGGDGVTQINFSDRSVRYIRITQTGSKSTRYWSIHELDIGNSSGSPLGNGGVKLARSGWTMIASNRAGDVSRATDSDASSRWATGELQRNGQWFEIDMQKSESFNKIVLETQGNPDDYPRSFTVSVSNDGSNFRQISSGSGNGDVTTIALSNQNARYIRLEQTGSDERNWWSIHEVNVYR